MATGSWDNTARVWDAESGKCLRELQGHTHAVSSCAWSPDGRRVATGGDDETARVWDAESGKCLREMQGHTHWVTSCAWSPDGRRVATGSYDKTARVWDAESGSCEFLLAAFSGGEAAALDCVQNGLRLRWASPGAWRHLACRVFDPEAEGWGSVDPVTRKWQPGPRGRTRILPVEFGGGLPEG